MSSIDKKLSDNPMHQLQNAQQIIQFSSPLPPPEILHRYEQVHPGLIKEIIDLTKIQNEHRRQLENKNLEAQVRHQEKRDSEAKIGQWFAFIISLIAIGGSIYTATQGYEGAASVIGAVGLTGLVARFINGRQEKNNQTTK